MPVFRIQNKKIVIRINCNDCPHIMNKIYTFGIEEKVKRFCTIQKYKDSLPLPHREIKNKFFINKLDRNDEINWFPDWCPLEDD